MGDGCKVPVTAIANSFFLNLISFFILFGRSKLFSYFLSTSKRRTNWFPRNIGVRIRSMQNASNEVFVVCKIIMFTVEHTSTKQDLEIT